MFKQLNFCERLRFAILTIQFFFYATCESIFNKFIGKKREHMARASIDWNAQTEPDEHHREIFRSIPTYVYLYGKMQQTIDARWKLLGYEKQDQTEVL